MIKRKPLAALAALAFATASIVLYLTLGGSHPCTHGASSVSGYLDKHGRFHYTQQPHTTGCTR